MLGYGNVLNVAELYEGNGGKGYYDKQIEKRDRKKQASIWIGLLVIMGSIFIFCIYRNIYEVILKEKGNTVTVPYTNSQETAVVHDSTGGSHVINIGGPLNAYDGDAITLYYWGNDISKAQPVTQMRFWIFVDFFFGGISAACGFFVYKSFKVTHHYTEKDVSE